LSRKFGEKNVVKCGEVERGTDLFLVFLHAALELMLVAVVALLYVLLVLVVLAVIHAIPIPADVSSNY